MGKRFASTNRTIMRRLVVQPEAGPRSVEDQSNSLTSCAIEPALSARTISVAEDGSGTSTDESIRVSWFEGASSLTPQSFRGLDFARLDRVVTTNTCPLKTPDRQEHIQYLTPKTTVEQLVSKGSIR